MAIESRPIRRMSWRRRRANSSLVIAVRPSVQRRRGRRRRATGRRQLLEQELHSHPHELDQLRVGALVGLQILAGIDPGARDFGEVDRKSTRLNSSHLGISYAVFCLKKKKTSNAI